METRLTAVAPLCGISVLLILAMPVAVCAQAPGVPPRPGFTLLSEEKVDRFRVQRWASADSPTDSPSGWCDCITLVFEAEHLLADLGESAGTQRITALPDVTADGRAELVVTTHSGGAHCCESTTIYSFDGTAPATLLEVTTGSCSGELTDVDRDGRIEFITCDDNLAYEFCSFAFSPMPPAVFAYDATQRRFRLATRRYAVHLPAPTAADVKAAFDEAGDAPDLLRCAALGPALHAAYTAGAAEGRRLFRQLYRRPDAAAVEEDVMALVQASGFWPPE